MKMNLFLGINSGLLPYWSFLSDYLTRNKIFIWRQFLNYFPYWCFLSDYPLPHPHENELVPWTLILELFPLLGFPIRLFPKKRNLFLGRQFLNYFPYWSFLTDSPPFLFSWKWTCSLDVNYWIAAPAGVSYWMTLLDESARFSEITKHLKKNFFTKNIHIA